MRIMKQLISGEHHLVAGYLMESNSPKIIEDYEPTYNWGAPPCSWLLDGGLFPPNKKGNKKSIIGFDPSPHQTRTGVNPKLMYNSIVRKKSRTICFHLNEDGTSFLQRGLRVLSQKQ